MTALTETGTETPSGTGSRTGAPLYPPTVVPAEMPLSFLRFLSTFVVNPLRTVPKECYSGGLTLAEGPKRTLFVTDPALIEDVLLRRADQFVKTNMERRVLGGSLGEGILIAEGASWRWQRRAMAPPFRHGDILASVPAMSAAADAMLDRWRRENKSVRAIDDDMSAVTFDVICRTMVSGGIGDETDQILKASADYLDRVSWEVGYTIVGLPEWLWHPAKRQMRWATTTLRRIALTLIQRRRAAPEMPPDLMTRLLAARDPETDKPMSDDLLVDNLITLLEAGHETTARALGWALYLLARSPEWQAQVSTEARAVTGTRPVTADDLPKLAVTQRVFKEAMRLYPPAPVLARTPLAPTEVGGVPVQPGERVMVPIFALHRNSRLWEDPDRFDPDRFLPEREAKIYRTQFMPFGAGPRICLGQSFAMVEATVILATVMRSVRFTWDGRHLPEPISRVTLRPKGGMPLGVEMVG